MLVMGTHGDIGEGDSRRSSKGSFPPGDGSSLGLRNTQVDAGSVSIDGSYTIMIVTNYIQQVVPFLCNNSQLCLSLLSISPCLTPIIYSSIEI